MQTIPISKARANFSDIINKVYYSNTPIAIGKQDRARVLCIKFPEYTNCELSEITNVNANSTSFDFLNNEEELYSLSDLKKSYV